MAQEPTPSAPTPAFSLPVPNGLPLRTIFPRVPGVKANDAVSPVNSLGGQAYSVASSFAPSPDDSSAGVRRITLAEAQQIAAAASNPLVRLAQLQVEAAKQHRMGVQAQYFPNISGTFYNMHLNKETGKVFALSHPLTGGVLSVPVNVIEKNQTAFNFSAVQPVTPLFAIYQLTKIARADEIIARAKAGMPVAETASKVEKNYFDLLVAQRELTSAEADRRTIQSKWLTASNSAEPRTSAEQETDMVGAEKAVVLSESKVKELTAALNEMLALPEGTRLELVPPEPLVEDVSMKEVADIAAASPEVVEAEQTAVKAHAASILSKTAYAPSVAIIGGYANQNIVDKLVLPHDFSYIGIIATYTVFDFGKREHGVKEARAQAEMADLGVQLTKAKAAAGVKSSYFDLERSRKLALLARRMVSAATVVEASYRSDNPEVESARAKMEADMFRAELEYRQAYAHLKSVMGDK